MKVAKKFNIAILHIMTDSYKKINDIIADARHIVVLQADNPDGDSLSSALALESILSAMNKQVSLVCGVDMPQHLRYLEGWSRVEKDVPNSFDASIIVDASTSTLFETFQKTQQYSWILTKPLVVIDHHQTTSGIAEAAVSLIPRAVATGEVIYQLANSLKWPMPLDAARYIAVSILSDSLGLTSEGTTVDSIRILADVVEAGVKLSEIETARRELMKREPELLHYKGRLLERVVLHHNNSIATVVIPWTEIQQYSSMYNPSVLVLDDMRMTVGVKIAIAFKIYPDGKVTAKLRTNSDGAIADKIADHFGGGGHSYAAGFKKLGVTNYEKLIQETVQLASKLLAEQL